MNPSRPRVAHLTSAHPPQDTRIFLKMCASLAAGGFDVTLIAPFVKGFDPRGIRYEPVTKPINRMARMLLGAFRVFWRAVKTPTAVVHLHDPELVPFGVILKLLGRRLIVDVHEDLPKQVMSKEYLHPAVRPVIAAMTRFLHTIISYTADAIVVATPAIAKNFPPGKTFIVQNFPITAELQAPIDAPYADRPLNLLYVGVLTEQRGLREMIAATALVAKEFPVKLQIVGDVSPASLLTEIKATLPSNVEFLGHRNRVEVAQLMATARVGLVLFHPEPNHLEAQPNKLFEYMSAGLPLVASRFPLWELVVGDCGVTCDPLKPQEIADAILRLLRDPLEAEAMGKRGMANVRTTYNWEAENTKLQALYARLAPG